MADKKYPVHLQKGSTNGLGGTFWQLNVNTRNDGRGRGGLALAIDIHTQTQGLCIAGNYISWDDLHKAEECAKAHARKTA
jgi:hypothetical protein